MSAAFLCVGSVGWAQSTDLLGRRIVAIEIRCAAPIDRQGLQRLIPMKIGDALRAERLGRTKQLLEDKELFSKVSVEPEGRGPGVAVIISLVRKPVINAIQFRGNEAISNDKLRQTIRLREGTPLTGALREYAIGRVHDVYAEQGFDAVKVVADVHSLAPGEVDVIFRIDEGQPLRIASIDIQGELPIPAGAIRDVIGLRAGARYVRAKAREGEKAIMRLLRAHTYYEVDVERSWHPEASRTGILRYAIDAGPPFSVTFSGNRHFSDKHLLGLMNLPERPIITDGTWRELARRAQHSYQEAGYYFAKVTVGIEAGPPKNVRFQIEEGRAFHVAKVTFDGNHGLSDSQLLAPMQTRPPSWIPWRRGVLLDDVFDDDLKRLWFLYRRYGYESAEIADARKRFNRERGEIFLTVVIEEGRQTIVRHVEMVGMEPIKTNLPPLSVAEGAPLDTEAVENDRQALTRALAGAGYTQATVKTAVTTEPDGATNAAAVRFTAVAGERQQVGTIIVQENFDTRARVILRELPFKRGDPLNPDALLRGQGDVYGLGLFRSVTVRPLQEDSTAKIHDIAVSVSEKVPGSLQWGAGYNTRDGLRGFLELGYNNLQGLARSVTLRGDFSLDRADITPNEYIGNLGFREPRLADTKWSLRSNLIAQRSTRSVDQFSLERLAFVPAIERTVVPGLQIGTEFQIEQARIFDVAQDVLVFNPRDEGRLRTISLGPFAVYDGRDDAFAPHRGVFDSVRLRYAPSEFGSDVPFIKLIAQHSHYVPLVDDLTFVYVARVGWAHVLESGQEVPIRERFFLGGRTTVRGFGENTIGPQGAPIIDSLGRIVHAGGDPLGGDLAVNLNAELRFPLIYGLGGAGFVDAGGLYLQDRSIRIEDFRRSAGLGLRYLTPVGPISLDYGFKLDRRLGESIGEVHFSIGTIF